MKKNKKKMKVDRLSNLSDDLILLILDRMNIKYAVQTCILSKRWSLLWTRISTLNFNTDIFQSLESFANFLRYVFIHYDASKLRTCSFGCNDDGWDDELINSILDYAIANKVQNLSLRCPVLRNEPYKVSSHLLTHLLTCQSLKTLSLDLAHIPMVPTFCSPCTSLTSLHLDKILINYLSGEQWLLNCVNLVNFVMTGCILYFHTFVISCPKLVNLVLDCYTYRRTTKIKISAPRLVSFHYSTYFTSNLIVSLDSCPALESVTIALRVNTGSTRRSDPRTHAANLLDLLKQLCGIESLTLSADIVKNISDFPDLMENLPSPFHNLKSLKLDMSSKGPCRAIIIPPQVRNFLLCGPQMVVLELGKHDELEDGP